jgi:hypothetical protein
MIDREVKTRQEQKGKGKFNTKRVRSYENKIDF